MGSSDSIEDTSGIEDWIINNTDKNKGSNYNNVDRLISVRDDLGYRDSNDEVISCFSDYFVVLALLFILSKSNK